MVYLYKYMEFQFAIEIVENSIFKISTLYSFKNQNRVTSATADPDEGFMYGTYTEPGPVGEVVNFDRINLTTHIGRSFTSDDCYLFCMSKVCSKKMFERFPEYDTCVQIKNIDLFYYHLTEAIKKITKIQPKGYKPCIYCSRNMKKEELETCDPVYLKDVSYSIEEEVRAVWFPETRSPKLEPKLIQCPEAAKLCSILFKK